jgi:hypothetical protein
MLTIGRSIVGIMLTECSIIGMMLIECNIVGMTLICCNDTDRMLHCCIDTGMTLKSKLRLFFYVAQRKDFCNGRTDCILRSFPELMFKLLSGNKISNPLPANNV